MNVYLIYLDPTYRNPENSGNDWDLYGITNEKKLYKGFVLSRNMKLFKIEKQQMTKEQYKNLSEEYRESILQFTLFATKKKYPKTLVNSYRKNIKDVGVITTFLEYQSVQEAMDNPYTMLDPEDMVNPLLFSREVRKMLRLIRYEQIYKMVILPFMGTDSFMVTSEENLKDSDLNYLDKKFIVESEDLDLPDLWVDELMIFIKLFGDLLNFEK